MLTLIFLLIHVYIFHVYDWIHRFSNARPSNGYDDRRSQSHSSSHPSQDSGMGWGTAVAVGVGVGVLGLIGAAVYAATRDDNDDKKKKNP